MPQLTWWEQVIIGIAITSLTALESKITNPTLLAALKATIAFLTALLEQQPAKPTSISIGAKIHGFLSKLP
jgi:hypothetical protein